MIFLPSLDDLLAKISFKGQTTMQVAKNAFKDQRTSQTPMNHLNETPMNHLKIKTSSNGERT
jgi:hypothetical protein